MHEHNSFVTLTYSDEHRRVGLEYRDFQLFCKRLRRKMGPFRFYMCGEYGELNFRPHFHACLFGMFFPDRRWYRSVGSGFELYRSDVLESLWPFGFSSIGDVTFESAAYVARYVMKKVTGNAARDHYVSVDSDGVCTDVVPEFTRMSLKPGIGASWLSKYLSDVFPRDYVVVRGVKCKPPRFYSEIYRSADPVAMDFVDLDRYVKSGRCVDDNTPARLAVREVVASARVAFKKRVLK
jgi:hypothetical protein